MVTSLRTVHPEAFYLSRNQAGILTEFMASLLGARPRL